MSFTLKFTVDGPPVAKGRARTAVRGGFVQHYTPEKTRAYEARVKQAAQDAMDALDDFDKGVITDAVDMKIVAYLPVPVSWSQKKQRAALAGEVLPTRRPDADNFAKAVLDACNGVVYRDDSLIVGLSVEKRYADRPRLIVCVELFESVAV